MAHGIKAEVDASDEAPGTLPFGLHLDLIIRDPDAVAELSTHPEGEERDQFALNALRIGLLALKQARGQVDAEAVRRESERLLAALENRLGEHSNLVHQRLSGSLKEYFDPQNGRFQERVQRLISQDGELEQVLKRQIGGEDSELRKTLLAHFGEESPLMKMLSPDQSKGFLAALRETLDEQLQSQSKQVLDQFSLDNKEGALSRFIDELTQNHGELSEQLQTRIDELAKQFSLDEENSALSHLVRNVERAQKTITSEFSLDDKNSALARLKEEILTLMTDHREMNQKFQEEVTATLRALEARKQESAKSTRHGLEFEDAVFEFIQHESQKSGDIATSTGNKTGRIKNCKVGDCVIELGPDSAAAGIRIVAEAKEKAGYTLATARDEIETARNNRDAQIGLFVFSKRIAPEGIEPLGRYGNDIFIVWDSEDVSADLYLRVGITLARALCVRGRAAQEQTEVDFTEIDKAILEVEKRSASLDDVETWATTIQNNSEKILKNIRATRKSLVKQAELLREKTDALKDLVAE